MIATCVLGKRSTENRHHDRVDAVVDLRNQSGALSASGKTVRSISLAAIGAITGGPIGFLVGLTAAGAFELM